MNHEGDFEGTDETKKSVSLYEYDLQKLSTYWK